MTKRREELFTQDKRAALYRLIAAVLVVLGAYGVDTHGLQALLTPESFAILAGLVSALCSSWHTPFTKPILPKHRQGTETPKVSENSEG